MNDSSDICMTPKKIYRTTINIRQLRLGWIKALPPFYGQNHKWSDFVQFTYLWKICCEKYAHLKPLKIRICRAGPIGKIIALCMEIPHKISGMVLLYLYKIIPYQLSSHVWNVLPKLLFYELCCDINLCVYRWFSLRGIAFDTNAAHYNQNAKHIVFFNGTTLFSSCGHMGSKFRDKLR